ncbi:MAG TPA: hypothetical protein VF042_16670 [Gemmatimonadaceae bacterium]
MKLFSDSIIAAVCSLVITGCGKTDGSSAAPAGDPTQTPAASQTADTAQGSQAATGADACAFITQKDLESTLGNVFAAGKPTQGEPSCTFTATNGLTIAVALPTAQVSEAEFNSWKQMAGAGAESVSGVGDAAYFWNSRLYIRSGNRTATLSVTDRDLTPELKAGLRKLGEVAASRLR